MSFPFAFDPRVIVRTPALPFPGQTERIEYTALLEDKCFLEAIFLASPVLYEECMKWKEGGVCGKKDTDKLMRSLAKYYLRMTSRCTPFGLFSACGVASWGDGDAALRINNGDLHRHTRLDMQYLCELAKNLAAWGPVRERLNFFPNNSMYLIANELRYVEYLQAGGSRNYRISAVTAAEYVNKIVAFAEKGVTTGQMQAFLVAEEIAQDEATGFIEALIQFQILVSELEPLITGQEFMTQIVMVLERIDAAALTGIPPVLEILKQVSKLLDRIDEGIGNDISLYTAIHALLDELKIGYDSNKLFQTDMIRKLGCKGNGGVVRGNGLGEGLQGQIREALVALNKLSIPSQNNALQAFAKRFHARYEDKEMPIMEVLDTEIGIGYQEFAGSCMSPLVEDLHIGGGGQEQRLAWSRLEMMLHEKLQEAMGKSDRIIELTDRDLDSLPADMAELPASFSVMFRKVEGDILFMESAGGSSAVNLMSRFAYADPEIGAFASDITKHEQEQDPEIIYAEIVHLPETRTGNILLHPAFRRYEIPYLAQSSVEREFQIEVQDLYVSVKKGRVVLRSKRLNKVVIPRLSTAHNFSLSVLPVYRFLCDLQLQDKKGALVFNWGGLRQQNRFLPRVVYKQTVLHLASWRFQKEDMEGLRGLEDDALKKAMAGFREKWSMPRFVVLSEGDNELFIDLDSPQMIQLWLESVKNKNGFVLKEFLRPDRTLTDEHGALYGNQFIAVLRKLTSSYAHMKDVLPAGKSAQDEKREFPLGSEWVYFKIYCGIKSADRILSEVIGPLTEGLQANQVIDKWFFIRYYDPDFHIRLRLHLVDTARIGELIGAAYSYLSEYEEKGYIWKLQTDTYKREMERYGSNAIRMAESLFHYDSKACVRMLNCTDGDERETIKWIWSLKAVDELLDCFHLSAEEKASLMGELKNSYAAEFNLDKQARTQLNDKYRINKQMIDQVMQGGEGLPAEWAQLIGILKERTEQMRPVVAEINGLYETGRMETAFLGVVTSYIHMMLNRIITAEPRMHEMVIYDFLFRHYKSSIARKINLSLPTADLKENGGFVHSND